MTSSWKVWVAAECPHRSGKWAGPNHHPRTGSYAVVLSQVSVKRMWNFTKIIFDQNKDIKLGHIFYQFTQSFLWNVLYNTFVTCGEERGPFRLALFICSDDTLFFPGCNIPCLVVCPSAFFLVSGILQYTNKDFALFNYIFRGNRQHLFKSLAALQCLTSGRKAHKPAGLRPLWCY